MQSPVDGGTRALRHNLRGEDLGGYRTLLQSSSGLGLNSSSNCRLAFLLTTRLVGCSAFLTPNRFLTNTKRTSSQRWYDTNRNVVLHQQPAAASATSRTPSSRTREHREYTSPHFGCHICRRQQSHSQGQRSGNYFHLSTPCSVDFECRHNGQRKRAGKTPHRRMEFGRTQRHSTSLSSCLNVRLP